VLNVDKPTEFLKYELNVPKVMVQNDNLSGGKDLISDIKEKVFQMEDVDPDTFVSMAKVLEAEGKVFEKNADGSFKVPKFELNLILKIKRKHLKFEKTKFKDI
jgi:hypothetical protein